LPLQIGGYSVKKDLMGNLVYTVIIPRARMVAGRTLPYKMKFLTDDINDIQNTIHRDLKISEKIQMGAGKVMVV